MMNQNIETPVSREALRRRWTRLGRPLAVLALVLGSIPLTGPLALLCVSLSVAMFAFAIKAGLDYYDATRQQEPTNGAQLAPEALVAAPEPVGTPAPARAPRKPYRPVAPHAA